MAVNTLKLFLQAAGLGIIAGSRAMSAPAIASHLLSTHPSKKLKKTPLNFMRATTTATAFKVLAVGEFVGDKLPSAPNRTALPGLTGRFLSGALAGASVYKAKGSNACVGAALGASFALLSAYGCFHLRRAAGKASKIPDPYIGALEDAVVIGAGAVIIKTA